MFYKTFLLFCVLLPFHSTFCQSLSPTVISANGGSNEANGVRLDWTLGELSVETSAKNSGFYTQGFHQPLLRIQSIITPLLPANGYSVTIYPNPFEAYFTFAITSVVDNKVNIQLTDISGLVIYKNTTFSKSNSLKIDMRPFASGVYILTLSYTSGATIGTYKIVKAS